MKLWDISGEGGFWKVQLDVRDLGGAILISRIVLELVLFLVGLLRLLLELLRSVLCLFGFQVKLGSRS